MEAGPARAGARRRGQVDTNDRSIRSSSHRAIGRSLVVEVLGGLLGPAQVARLDERDPTIAILPARLDLDLLCLADEPEHDRVPGTATALDRLDRGVARGERQEGENLPEVVSQLRAEVLDHPVDVAGDGRGTECLSALANVLFVHRCVLERGWISRRVRPRPGAVRPRPALRVSEDQVGRASPGCSRRQVQSLQRASGPSSVRIWRCASRGSNGSRQSEQRTGTVDADWARGRSVNIAGASRRYGWPRWRAARRWARQLPLAA